MDIPPDSNVSQVQIVQLSEQQMLERFGGYYYGMAVYSTNTVFILDSLDHDEMNFVLAHELEHLRTGYRGKGFWKNELRPIIQGAKVSFTGFVKVVFRSLFSWKRLKLYFNRLRNGI